MYVFFFSSRRRHTRLQGDWSSDVCSSDLGGGIFHAAVADFIAAATNPYVAYWGASPGCAEMEHTVVRWFCDVLGLPKAAGGILTSGGPIANLTALITARALRLGDRFPRGTLYASHQ